jgi:enamine deaminase RidA (YjgF/YER057c/UK114 family)
MKRKNFSSGAPLEEKIGYSRMVTVGNHVFIGGTTAVKEDGTVAGATPYEQARYIFQKFSNLLKAAETDLSDVVKVKAYVTDMAFVMEVADAYSELFKEIRPVFTVVETPMLNRPTQLVEIELEAIRCS